MNCLLDHSLHVFDPEGSPSEVATLIQRTLDRSATHRARRETVARYAWSAIWRNYLEPLLNTGSIPSVSCIEPPRVRPDLASGI
jgi:hypothetical protein